MGILFIPSRFMPNHELRCRCMKGPLALSSPAYRLRGTVTVAVCRPAPLPSLLVVLLDVRGLGFGVARVG